MNYILPTTVILGLGVPVYNLVGGYLFDQTQGKVNLPPINGTYVSIFALVGLLAFLGMILFV